MKIKTIKKMFMNKLYAKLLVGLLFVLGTVSANAQIPVTVSGTAVTSPALAGSYTSLADALTALNAITAYPTPGTIIFTMAAGSSETAPATGLTIGSATLNPLLSADNAVTLIKASGTVTLNAGVGTATPDSAIQDGMLNLVGADYITIDGLTLTDGNAANPATMEYGIGFFKWSATDGSNNNTIKNCTITLNRINNASSGGPAANGSRGINVVNSLLTTQTTDVIVTEASGTNSNNRFYTNTIQNCNVGMTIRGYASLSPYTLSDQHNDVGGSAAASGNIIKNFGGGPALNSATGIHTYSQYGLKVSYNTINNNDGGGVDHGANLLGIFLSTAPDASETITNNTITLKGGGTHNNIRPIYNNAGASGTNNTVTISNNTITGCTYTTATDPAFEGIRNEASAATVNINSNVFTNNATNATSGLYIMIINVGAVTVALNINSNNINGMTFNAATSGYFYAIASAYVASTAAVSINSNNIEAVTYSVLCPAHNFFIFSDAHSLSFTANFNTFTDLNINTSGDVTFISVPNDGPTNQPKTVNNNAIVTAFNKGGPSGNIYFIRDASNSAAGNVSTIQNNNFSNITVAGTSTITGIDLTDSYSTKSITGNTFNNWTSTGTGAIKVINVPYWNGVSTLSTNTITNITGQGPVLGITMGNTLNAATSITVASNTITNLTSTGTGGAVTGIDCTNSSTLININNNSISALASPGAWAVTGISIGGGAPTINVFTNIITNITGQGIVTGINVGGVINTAMSRTVTSNTISNLTSTGAGGAVTGITCTNSSTQVNININNNSISTLASIAVTAGISIGGLTSTSISVASNTITNLTSTGTDGAVTGIDCRNYSPLININNNLIRTLASTGDSAVTGIFIGGITSDPTINVFKNTIYDVSGSHAGSTVNGILVSRGGTITIHNNRIGDLRTPAANAENPLAGLNITDGTTVNAYYNTINLNGTSSGALFGSSAISASTDPTLTLNNNIFTNTSTPNGAGLSVAYRRSATSLASYDATSNRNDFYAATIFTDGTNTFTTIGDYIAFVTARDANSISEPPPYISTIGGNAHFLKLNSAIPNQLESGGANIAGITDDFENNRRQGNSDYVGTGTAPDIGADEFNPLYPVAIDVLTIRAQAKYQPAAQGGNGVLVDWTAKTELDMDRYELERSFNGSSFSRINTTTAVGNSHVAVNYSWLDANPQTGVNFYRIKAIDKPGEVKYTNVVTVNFGKANPGITVYPNPVKGNGFNLQLTGLEKGIYGLAIFNNLGQMVYRTTITHAGGSTSIPVMPDNAWAKGIYELVLTGQNTRITNRITKNK